MANPDFQYKQGYVLSLIITACAGSFYFGYQGGILAVFGSDFSPLGIEIVGDEASVLLSILPFTAAFGAILAGPYSNKGRRKALLLTDIFAILGPIIENINGYWPFLAGRAICGVAVGLNSALVPLFVNEIAPVEVKGALGTLNQVFICVGLIFGYAIGIGPYESNDWWWRVMMLFPAALSLIRAYLFLTVFKLETPLFSIKENDIDSARQMLDKIYINNVEGELERIRDEYKKQTEKGKISYNELFSQRFKTRFMIGCGLAALQQLSGINAICYSATTVLGGSQIASCMVGVGQLVGGLASTSLIGKYGRKTILLWGTIGCCAFLFAYCAALLTTISALHLTFLFAYIVSFGISLGPVVWLYIPEVVPDVGVSLTTMTNWFLTAAVVQTFQVTESRLGPIPNFMTFGVFCVIGAIAIFTMVKETKGKTNAEIDRMFSGDRKVSLLNGEA